MIGEHLTIKQARNELKQLEHEFDVYATKKNLNLLRTQPKAMQLKDIIVDSSHTNIDSFLNYVTRDEELDLKLYSLLVSIYEYKAYIAKEIKRLAEYDEIGYIRYLREEEKKSWREIDRMLHRGEDYSRTKYKRFKNSTKTIVNSN